MADQQYVNGFPVLTDAQMQAFADAQEVREVRGVGDRFCIPIPALDDGQGDLLLPNVKELQAILKSSGAGNEIVSTLTEAFPQCIPTDGSQMLVMGDVSENQAVAYKALYQHIVGKHGKVDRDALQEFFDTVRGLHYNPETHKIEIVESNIGFSGDLYSIDRTMFKQRHWPYATQDALDTADNTALLPGHYSKRPVAAKAYFINDAFCRIVPGQKTVQQFSHGAMVTVGYDKDRIVSTIHPNDINKCCVGSDGKKLRDTKGEIHVPHYSLPQVAPNLAEFPGNKVSAVASCEPCTYQGAVRYSPG